ncbi:LytTR family DNA-binding domain-containing protein [Sphingobium yanoikuyae]|uniref:LytTR family DNA-binding domain-containing protein n=1 Tax=Sphingobium yanoikuyae TaxID=13690 RepID=UPI0028AB3985|nr:LytTR family DNA-binding domain-containing protein [Sphingobium yanoikuyae]
MLLLAGIIGFMGPFGTYMRDGLPGRIGHWWLLLMGAYILVRPMIWLLRRLALRIDLSVSITVFSGVSLCVVPLAFLWRNVGRTAFRDLDGFTGLLPFSFLCALTVLVVTHWAEQTDRRLAQRGILPPPADAPPAEDTAATSPADPAPALRHRLSAGFAGPILALQSEDHYVRVHGAGGSELLLMRLRDAIAEMEGVAGAQVHRSWWIAHRAILRCDPAGRSWLITLDGGLSVPVARDSVARLQRAGFLPAS